jgi:hypothetical protein
MAEPLTPSYHATAAAPLVSLQAAKDRLKITDDDHDDEVRRTAAAATDVILDYLKHGADPAWDDTTVPLPVQAAILLMLSHLYEPEAEQDADKLWGAIDRLLARFRDPAIA